MRILFICLVLASCGQKIKGELSGEAQVNVNAPQDFTVKQKLDIIGMYNDLIEICKNTYGESAAFDECREQSAQFIFDLNLDQGEVLE